MTRVHQRYWIRKMAVVVWGGLVLTLIAASSSLAERPSAPKLLPKSTLAYLRIADCPELIEKFQETSMGKLGRDEKIKPLVSQLYGSVAQAFQRVQEQIGVSLDQILALPQGELCAALVARDEGTPVFVAIIDVGDQLPIAQQLLQAAEQQAASEGTPVTREQVGDVTLNLLAGGKGVYFEREATICFSNNAEMLKTILATWDDPESSDSLADNRKFTAIMSRSVGTKDERPQLTFFVDPIEIFQNVARGNAGAQIALAMLPTLGLDGIKAAGGSVILATEEFDSISHMHLLLDNPREGLVRILAMEEGDTTPESWVPVDAASYMTVNWNVEQAVGAAREMFDKIRGPGALDNELRSRFNDQLGIDVQKDVIDQLAGRFTHVSWFEKKARVNAGTNLVGVKLNDVSAFRKTLDSMLERAGANAKKNNYRGITYYSFTSGNQPPNFNQELLRLPTPSIALVGDFLLLSDSSECLKAAISSKKDPDSSLANELDFKLIASRIRQHLGSKRPSMIAFQRPEESMRSFYELAASPNTRRQLDEAAKTNPVFRALGQALKDNPLPPFSAIAKYLAPGGGMMVSDQAGIHYIAFSLRRD